MVFKGRFLMAGMEILNCIPYVNGEREEVLTVNICHLKRTLVMKRLEV